MAAWHQVYGSDQVDRGCLPSTFSLALSPISFSSASSYLDGDLTTDSGLDMCNGHSIVDLGSDATRSGVMRFHFGGTSGGAQYGEMYSLAYSSDGASWTRYGSCSAASSIRAEGVLAPVWEVSLIGLKFRYLDLSTACYYPLQIREVVYVSLTTTASPPPPSPSASILVSMNTGWTWISSPVEAADMSVGALISLSSLQQGDSVKGQFAFTDYYGTYGWFGQLTALTADTMYAVKLATSTTLTLSGVPVSLPKAIDMTVGWVWMPNPYLTTKAASEYMPSHSGGYVAGDQVKSQFSFSEYYGVYGWYGTLTSFEPGTGYRLKVTNGGTATFE